jgi:hypothetical protein
VEAVLAYEFDPSSAGVLGTYRTYNRGTDFTGPCEISTPLFEEGTVNMELSKE